MTTTKKYHLIEGAALAAWAAAAAHPDRGARTWVKRTKETKAGNTLGLVRVECRHTGRWSHFVIKVRADGATRAWRSKQAPSNLRRILRLRSL